MEDHPGVAAEIFGALADANINVDMIVQSEARQEGRQNIVFTCPDRDAPRAAETIEAARGKIGVEEIHIRRDVAKVSVIGIGMRSHAGVAKTMFASLAQKGINIQVIATSEIKISVLIDASYTELAVRALHTAYGLDAAWSQAALSSPKRVRNAAKDGATEEERRWRSPPVPAALGCSCASCGRSWRLGTPRRIASTALFT